MKLDPDPKLETMTKAFDRSLQGAPAGWGQKPRTPPVPTTLPYAPFWGSDRLRTRQKPESSFAVPVLSENGFDDSMPQAGRKLQEWVPDSLPVFDVAAGRKPNPRCLAAVVNDTETTNRNFAEL